MRFHTSTSLSMKPFGYTLPSRIRAASRFAMTSCPSLSRSLMHMGMYSRSFRSSKDSGSLSRFLLCILRSGYGEKTRQSSSTFLSPPPFFRFTQCISLRVFPRPERWQSPPNSISAIPGVWGNLLTFLGGTHACIGYRFSLVEYVLPLGPFVQLVVSCPPVADQESDLCRMKAIIFTLIRTFEFELAVPAEEIVPMGSFLQRPALRHNKDEGTQLPLLIRPYRRT